MKKYRVAAAAAGLLIAAHGPAWTQTKLPGGASALNETHGSWTVACAEQKSVLRCAVSQSQVKGANRQRVLAIELTAEPKNAAKGVLLLPFGLKLDAGVSIAIDDKAALPVQRFSTCLPTGCVVPLAFDAATVAAMRQGKTLTVKAMANENDQEITLPVSLSGFGSALDRAAKLGGS